MADGRDKSGLFAGLSLSPRLLPVVSVNADFVNYLRFVGSPDAFRTHLGRNSGCRDVCA